MSPPGPVRGLAAYAAGLALVVSPVPAHAADTPRGIVVRDGMTQPVFSLADAIVERVWVRDAARHRPRRPEGPGGGGHLPSPGDRHRGLRVPVIFEHSPYRKDTWDDVPYPSVLVDELPQAAPAGGPRPAPAIRGGRPPGRTCPASLDDYYVPRGYAVVVGQSIGTGDSDGCPTTGDQAETLGTKAVIDWLNGRARAYDAAAHR